MSDIEEQVSAQVEAFLLRRLAERVEQATRSSALNAAAVTITGSQYGHIGNPEGHVQQVLDLAMRYAAWIKTGEDLRIDLPPVDF